MSVECSKQKICESKFLLRMYWARHQVHGAAGAADKFICNLIGPPVCLVGLIVWSVCAGGIT